MFSDAEVAKSFSLSKAKYMHHINYGLGLHFKEKLIKTVTVFPYFSLSLDETLNGKLQEHQQDCHVDYIGMMIENKYAQDTLLFLRFLSAQNIFNFQWIDSIQTRKVLKLLGENQNGKEYDSLINIGSCGSHVYDTF